MFLPYARSLFMSSCAWFRIVSGTNNFAKFWLNSSLDKSANKFTPTLYEEFGEEFI